MKATFLALVAAGFGLMMVAPGTQADAWDDDDDGWNKSRWERIEKLRKEQAKREREYWKAQDRRQRGYWRDQEKWQREAARPAWEWDQARPPFDDIPRHAPWQYAPPPVWQGALPAWRYSPYRPPVRRHYDDDDDDDH